MRKWTHRPIESIGLALSNTAIQLAHLTLKSNKWCLHQFLDIPIRIALEETWESAASRALQQAATQLNTKYRQITLAIPEVLGFTYTLSIDPRKLSNWRAAALLAAAPNLPIPIDKVYSDFQQVSLSMEKSSALLGVFCRRDIIDSCTYLLKLVGFKPITIEMESHALERACQYLYALDNYPDCWAWVNVEVHTITLLLWNKNSVLSVTSDSLEDSNSLEIIAAQIYSALMRSIGTYSTNSLKALWVVGNHPKCGVIETQCRLHLELPNPIPHKVKCHLDIHSNEQSSVYVALGLALRGCEIQSF